MNVSKETEKNIAQLQMLEQNAQHLVLQRQQFHMRLLETENALKELNITKEKPFKIIGNLMIAAEKKQLEQELTSKKDMLQLRITNYEKQEEKIKKKINDLQQSIMGSINKKGDTND